MGSKLNHICRAGLVTVLSKYDPRATVQEAALLPSLSLRQSLLDNGESRDDDVDDEHNDNGDNDNDLLTNVQIPNVADLEIMDISKLFPGSRYQYGGTAVGGGIQENDGNMTKYKKNNNGEDMMVIGGINKEKKKNDHEKDMRRRARRRNTYLSKLAAAGRYDPEKPSRPDPERWIAKSQRSGSRRWRRGGRRNGGGGGGGVSGGGGAQGGGTGTGAEKEEARLDAAARAAERSEATSSSSTSRPSTAHLCVSSSQGPLGKAGRRR